MRFLGVGTGRCGTMSLARILDRAQHSVVTHERYHPLWYGAPNQPEVQAAKEWFSSGPRDELRGDVSSFWMPHVIEMQEAFPDLRVICLHRRMQGVVDSFLRWCGGLSNLRPCDMAVRTKHPVHRLYIHLFPTIDAPSARMAWEVYWHLCEKMIGEMAMPLYHIAVDQLNDDDALHGIYQFLHVERENRVFPEQRLFNANPA